MKTVSIMQPYFLPYIGYLQLIANSDEFIFFDEVQYNTRSWMNRNRILHPNKNISYQYISVPIKKHSQGTLIKDVIINYIEKWENKILGQITMYKKLNAPFYRETRALLIELFNKKYTSFLELCIESIKRICNYLEIDFKYEIASNITYRKDLINEPGDWALAISKRLKAETYINPYGGYEIFDEEKFNNSNINLRFLKPNLSAYKQSKRTDFFKGLSIIDILMFNSKKEIKDMLFKDFKLYKKFELNTQQRDKNE